MTLTWIICACTLLALEMMTTTFVLLAFATGAGGAALVASLGGSTVWQIGTFIAVSLLFFFLIRPLIVKWWSERDKRIPQTNAQGLIGKMGKVVETIDAERRTGRVQVDGDNFLARSTDGSIIAQDTHVVIKELDSTIVIVAPTSEEPTA